MQLIAKNKDEARLFLTWICLNSVDFWGNDETVTEHKSMLRKYRKSVAATLGVPSHQVKSEMLDLYSGNEKNSKKIN